jgi:hypothetical protein
MVTLSKTIHIEARTVILDQRAVSHALRHDIGGGVR